MRSFRRLADARTLFALLAAAALLLVGVACEAGYEDDGAGWGDEEAFNEWDENEDGNLTEEEFTENVDWFDEYDENDDGYLTEQEFNDNFANEFENAGGFGTYDENDDGQISEEEFNSGLFDDFDQNDDDQIGADEWGA